MIVLKVEMVKSWADICRDYRRRLKERDNEGYLKKERERRRRNYVPSALLCADARNARQQRNRADVAKCRQKKKTIQQQLNTENAETSGCESVSSSRNESLVVAMKFPGRAIGSKKRLMRDCVVPTQKLNILDIGTKKFAKC